MAEASSTNISLIVASGMFTEACHGRWPLHLDLKLENGQPQAIVYGVEHEHRLVGFCKCGTRSTGHKNLAHAGSNIRKNTPNWCNFIAMFGV